MNSVYYVVFADDLVLVGANLTRLEEETNKLDTELARLGMCINADKTKWMMFLPPFPTTIPAMESLQLRLGGVALEMVQEFTYLGFTLDCYASLDLHVRKREKLLLAAASISGKRMRQLEVSNLRSLRSYFYALVSSQLYGQSCASFSREGFEWAQKIFLHEAVNLPRSFPIIVACFLLGCDSLEAITLRARLRYLQHLVEGNRMKASLSAMLLDRLLLLPRRIGWTHDLGSVVPSLSAAFDLRAANLLDPSQTNEIFTDLSRALARILRDSLNCGSSSHFPPFSPPGLSQGRLAISLVNCLSNLPGLLSYFWPISHVSPFYLLEMHLAHLVGLQCTHLTFSIVTNMPHLEMNRSLGLILFLCLSVENGWKAYQVSLGVYMAGQDRQIFFNFQVRHRVDEYYEELGTKG